MAYHYYYFSLIHIGNTSTALSIRNLIMNERINIYANKSKTFNTSLFEQIEVIHVAANRLELSLDTT